MLIVLVAWLVSHACLPTVAVLVLKLAMKFYAGHCLLLLLASMSQEYGVPQDGPKDSNAGGYTREI
jgi:hypothetical protein